MAAVAYLLLERAIKKKRRGVLMRGLPNLDLVEAVNAAGAKIGVPLLIITALAGIVMGYREWGAAYQWDPKNWVTFAIIAIYGTQLAFSKDQTAHRTTHERRKKVSRRSLEPRRRRRTPHGARGGPVAS